MTCRKYGHNAWIHERPYGSDWLLRIARKPRSDKGRKQGAAATAPQTDQRPKNAVSVSQQEGKGARPVGFEPQTVAAFGLRPSLRSGWVRITVSLLASLA